MQNQIAAKIKIRYGCVLTDFGLLYRLFDEKWFQTFRGQYCIPVNSYVSNQFTKFAISMFAFLFCANFTQQKNQHTLLIETFAGIKF